MLQKNPLLDHLNAIYRYRLVAVCTFVVGCALTVWTVRALPNVYGSTTLIMVEPQDVPEAYVRATVSWRIEQRLQALSQEVLSRTRLEAIIDDFNLFPEMQAQKVPRERMVDRMRSKIQIQVFPSDNAFRISYEGGDPQTVQRVTARLAGLYIDENLRIREQHVNGTTEFMENELEKTKRDLEQQEARILEFKQQHMGELPEQRDTNVRTVEGLQTQLRTVSMALDAAMERKLTLEKEAAEARSLASLRPASDGGAVAAGGSLRQLEAQLAALRGRYTDEYPDIIRIETQIAKAKSAAMDDHDGAEASDPLLPPELSRSLVQVKFDIGHLRQQEEDIRKAIEAYHVRIENTFGTDQALMTLTRDYGVMQKEYQTLLDKKLEAQLSQNLERRQKGERFRILDPASLPETPARPNRQFLRLAGLGGSAGLGILLPIALSLLSASFHRVEEVTTCSLPVLAVIPQVLTHDVRSRRRRYRLRVLALSALALALGVGTVSIYAKYLF